LQFHVRQQIGQLPQIFHREHFAGKKNQTQTSQLFRIQVRMQKQQRQRRRNRIPNGDPLLFDEIRQPRRKQGQILGDQIYRSPSFEGVVNIEN